MIPRIIEFVIMINFVAQFNETRLKSKALTVALVIPIYAFFLTILLPVRRYLLLNSILISLCALMHLFTFFKGKRYKIALTYYLILLIPLGLDLIISTFVLGVIPTQTVSSEVYFGLTRQILSTAIVLLFSIVSTIILSGIKWAGKRRFIMTVLIQLLLAASEFGFLYIIFKLCNDQVPENLIFIITLTLVPAVAVNLYINNAITYAEELSAQERELEFERQRENSEHEYYMLALENDKKLSSVRHDLANSLQTAYVLVSTSEKEKGKELIDELTVMQKSVSTLRFCDNPIINTVIALKKQLAVKSGIDMEVKISDSLQGLPLNDMELTSVFTNLLDNAVEGAQQSSAKDKRITLSAGIRNGFLVVKTINSCELVLDGKELPPTAKKDKALHGHGMRILSAAAQKHGGDFTFSADGGEFTAIASFAV